MLLKKILIYFWGLLNLGCFYFILQQPQKIWQLIFVILILSFLIIVLITGKQGKRKKFLSFFILNLLFPLASMLLLLILENIYLRYLLILLTTFSLVFFWRLILNYLYQPQKYHPFSLAVFFIYASFLIIFFSAAGLYALGVFLNFAWWLIAGILSLLILILLFLNQEIGQTTPKNKLQSNFILALCFFEITALLNWWPINYYLKGFILSTLYYFIAFFHFNSTTKKLDKKTLFWLIPFILLIILIFVQTRWS